MGRQTRIRRRVLALTGTQTLSSLSHCIEIKWPGAWASLLSLSAFSLFCSLHAASSHLPLLPLSSLCCSLPLLQARISLQALLCLLPSVSLHPPLSHEKRKAQRKGRRAAGSSLVRLGRHRLLPLKRHPIPSLPFPCPFPLPWERRDIAYACPYTCSWISSLM